MLGGRLSKGKGSSEPKLCDVKTPADFIAAYLRVPLKHAYEVIDDVRGCHPFLDLPIYSSAEYEAACRVLCTAASNVLRSWRAGTASRRMSSWESTSYSSM